MCESITSNDRFIRLYRHIHQAGYHTAGRINLLRIDIGFDVDIAKALANMFGLEAVPQTEGTLEALGEDVGVTKEAVAIKKGDSDTAKAVQAALQKLMDDGTYMKVLKHWGVENGSIDKAEINPTDLG